MAKKYGLISLIERRLSDRVNDWLYDGQLFLAEIEKLEQEAAKVEGLMEQLEELSEELRVFRIIS